MIALHDVFVVLENYLDEGPVVSPQDGCIEVYPRTTGRLWDAPCAEDSVYLEVVCQLHRRVGRHMGHAVECVSLLAVHLSS